METFKYTINIFIYTFKYKTKTKYNEEKLKPKKPVRNKEKPKITGVQINKTKEIQVPKIMKQRKQENIKKCVDERDLTIDREVGSYEIPDFFT